MDLKRPIANYVYLEIDPLNLEAQLLLVYCN